MQVKRESIGSDDMPALIRLPSRRPSVVTLRKTPIPEFDHEPSRRMRVACCRRLVSDFTADGKPICPFHESSASILSSFPRSRLVYLAALVFLAIATSSLILIFRPVSVPVSLPSILEIPEPAHLEISESVSLPQPVAENPEVALLKAEQTRLTAVEEALRSEIAALRDSLRAERQTHSAIANAAAADTQRLMQYKRELEEIRLLQEKEAETLDQTGSWWIVLGVVGGLGLLRGLLSSVESKNRENEDLRRQVAELQDKIDAQAVAVAQAQAEAAAAREKEPISYYRAPAVELSPLNLDHIVFGRASEEPASELLGGTSEKENVQPSEIIAASQENEEEEEDQRLMGTLERVTLREAYAMRQHVIRTRQKFADQQSNNRSRLA